jgi:beta-glucosidase
MYFKGEPLYPFGYGLSYTTFQYSNLRTSTVSLPRDGQITVSLDVTNTGARDGDEVVQVYVQHLGSKVERPQKELRGFERVHLARGETKTVQIPLKAQTLAYWDEARSSFVVEEEPIRITVGGSSADVRSERIVKVTQ